MWCAAVVLGGVMVARAASVGVPVAQLRAAVTLARKDGDVGVAWPVDEWERLWVRLTPIQQHVVYLRVLVGLGSAAAAAELRLCRGAVDGAWRRALARLRDAMPHAV